MRTVFAWIDYGDGWENLTSHLRDQAALSGVSIEWGASGIAERPDVAVCRLDIRDHTGTHAGRAATPAGSLIAIQLTRSPTWRDLQRLLTPADSTWRDRSETWATLHEPVEPDPSSPPDWRDAMTLFEGTLSVGTTVTPDTDGSRWRVSLYAQSLAVQLTRADIADRHPGTLMGSVWSGTVGGLLDAVRGVLDAMPQGVRVADGVTLPDAGGATLVGWDTTSQTPTVTPMDVLDELTSWNPGLPQWFETHPAGEVLPRIRPVSEAMPAVVTVTDGGAIVSAGDMRVSPVPVEALIDVTGSLESPTPMKGLDITVVEATAKTETEEQTATMVTGVDRKETTVTIPAADMPGIIQSLGESLSVSSLIASNDDTMIDVTGWTPDSGQRETARRMLAAMNRRLTPQMAVSTRRTSADTYPYAFLTEPTLWWIHDTKWRLEDDTGSNPVDGVYLSIGGTLTFTRANNIPLLRHEPTIIPLPTTINDERTTDNG